MCLNQPELVIYCILAQLELKQFASRIGFISEMSNYTNIVLEFIFLFQNFMILKRASIPHKS